MTENDIYDTVASVNIKLKQNNIPYEFNTDLNLNTVQDCPIKIGQTVEFVGKDSYFKGNVVALFYKLDKKSIRCVVQDERGLLLIKSPKDAIIC
jgi:hypothetical protein